MHVGPIKTAVGKLRLRKQNPNATTTACRTVHTIRRVNVLAIEDQIPLIKISQGMENLGPRPMNLLEEHDVRIAKETFELNHLSPPP
jgi:hypothetical protein